MRQSKFKIGSSAFFIYSVSAKEASTDKTDVRYIVCPDMMMVNRVSKDEQGYHYSLVSGHDDVFDWCYEENVFASEPDAVQEAERRNKTLTEA